LPLLAFTEKDASLKNTNRVFHSLIEIQIRRLPCQKSF